MKDIWLVARYIPNLLWRLIKEVVSLARELYIEMPLYFLSVIGCGVLDDFREYKKRKNATAGDDSSGNEELDFFYFFERERTRRASSNAEVDPGGLDIFLQAYCDYAAYRHPELGDRK